MQTLNIESIDINTATFILDTNNFIYDGTEKRPQFSIKNGEITLEEEKDYTVKYDNNLNVGTAKIILEGKGHYKGTIEKDFTISPQDLSNGQATVNERIVYNGKAQEPQVDVKNYKGNTLTVGKDYSLKYSNNIDAGIATVTITGIGNYAGTITKQFTIDKNNIIVEINDFEITYDGKEHGIVMNITTDLDGAVIKYGTTEECNLSSMPTYKNVGTYKIYYEITANNYNTLSGSVNLKIKEKNISSSNVTLDADKYIHNGIAIKPLITVKDENIILSENQDYTSSYDNNVNVGIGTITITGKGNYTGNINVPFNIEKGIPIYTIPTGIIATQGSTLKDVVLPSGFSWEDDINTEVGEIGLNTFKCTYTPEDTNNYNIVNGIDVTLKVTEKLMINVEKYITQISDDDSKIYINDIEIGTSLKEFENNIKTNGTIEFYESNGNKIENDEIKIKTGIKMDIKSLNETISYILVVPGDNNGDGKFNSVDLLKLARYLVQLDTDLKGEYLHASDIYKDKKINTADLLKMSRIMSGLDSFK